MNEITREEGKKRGRRPKNQKKEYVINQERSKFYVDVSDDKENLDLIFSLLKKANAKNYGREINFKDLYLLLLTMVTDKDIEKLQEISLSEMEKVERSLDEYNKKNNTNLALGEFLVKRLGLN
ncbi:MAG: hypothetical protein JNM93_01670 [Bacteriovoracaceae bacterium]|nr:hypothetical protein [Bacteriovoracaceae bacterium]